jgi:hypothetical protein
VLDDPLGSSGASTPDELGVNEFSVGAGVKDGLCPDDPVQPASATVIASAGIKT